MNYFNFVIKGVNGLQEQYIRDKYPAEPTIYYSGNVDNFQGTVTIIKQDDQTKTIQIDKVFEITLISDEVIQNCKKVWSELKKSTKITFIVTLIGGLAGIAAAVAMGVLSPSLLIPAIAVGVIALTIFAFSFFARKRNLEAGNELNKWTDPTNDLIEDCKKLNDRLKAEDKMKVEIEFQITKYYKEILESLGKGEFSEVRVDLQLQCLATAIHNIWTNHALKLLNEGGTKIPLEKVYETLDPYIKEFPILEGVKKYFS